MTIPNIGYARSSLEIDYWFELHPCPSCGDRDIGTPKTKWGMIVTPTGDIHGGFYHVTCPRCGHQRSISFYDAEEPDSARGIWTRRPYGHIGGATPSRIIGAHEFAAELARCSREIHTDFTPMTEAELTVHGDLLANGITCSIELAKFLPEAATRVPEHHFATDAARAYREAHPEQFERSYIEERRAFFIGADHQMRAEVARRDAAKAAPARPPAPVLPAFSLASIKFHELWVRDGEAGDGIRLHAIGADARDSNLARRDLSRAILDKVTLDRANLASASLHQAELRDVYLRGTQLASADLAGATLTHCELATSDLRGALLDGATIEDCDFSGADLSSASLHGATVTRSSFAGATAIAAWLDDAVFTDCDLRGADLSLPRGDPARDEVAERGLTGARFVRCDLRDTNWTGRDLAGVALVDCVVAGALGLVADDDAKHHRE